MTYTLPADVARCAGVGSDAEGWREGCDVCLRRLAPPVDPAHALWIAPPLIVAFWCPNLLEADPAVVRLLDEGKTEGGEE